MAVSVPRGLACILIHLGLPTRAPLRAPDRLDVFLPRLGPSRREIASYLGVSTPAITYIIRSGKAAVEEHGMMDIF